MAEALSHVACVDDDPDILLVASLALETVGGLRVTTFQSARRAFEGLVLDRPDLLLLDVMMPEMDGPAFLKTLLVRKDLASLPVVFMTARVQAAEIRHYKALGAAGVVAKPFDPMTLATEVRSIWQSWRGVSPAPSAEAASV
jgi:CheY-like chemotaxis protein